MGAVQHLIERVETINCGECGLTIAAPEAWWSARRRDGKTFYCPNGHHLSYTETETDRLRKQIAEKDRQLEWEKATSQRRLERAEATERRLAASKGQITKLKKRVGNGVCPCCKRTFRDLARHMGAKHPDFAEPDPE